MESGLMELLESRLKDRQILQRNSRMDTIRRIARVTAWKMCVGPIANGPLVVRWRSEGFHWNHVTPRIASLWWRWPTPLIERLIAQSSSINKYLITWFSLGDRIRCIGSDAMRKFHPAALKATYFFCKAAHEPVSLVLAQKAATRNRLVSNSEVLENAAKSAWNFRVKTHFLQNCANDIGWSPPALSCSSLTLRLEGPLRNWFSAFHLHTNLFVCVSHENRRW